MWRDAEVVGGVGLCHLRSVEQLGREGLDAVCCSRHVLISHMPAWCVLGQEFGEDAGDGGQDVAVFDLGVEDDRDIVFAGG